MKPRGSNELEKSKVLPCTQLSESPIKANRESARNEVGMTILWFILGTVCAGLAWVLLTILLK
ncbi:MAG: hypothetical protein JO251_11905 [Verrucomicrobia bacterium]|jgi:hypothetical protein|nr:hypothetical protein [Verrucomicrobiota bacterium]